MNKSFKNQARIIIEEFAKEIDDSKIDTNKSISIRFRDDKITGKTRKIYKVPLELLRFRKDNGRIASDVMTYEKEKGPLNETTDFGQLELKKFLAKKDPDPTKELTNSIIKEGQDEPAIITSDGFLINGNRRKMVFEELLNKNKGNEKYKYLKVVILPGKNDNEEPLPTNEEIEQIENRYQFQKMGKAEYYNFDMALAVKRKLDLGMALEEILADDPNYETLEGKALQRKIQEFKDEYIEPLKCVDKYLLLIKRPGHYNTISEGRGDSEGRWQAFLDYYKLVYKKIIDENQRIKLGIQDGEEGKIENIAFKIIRKRVLQGVNKKAHQIIRDLPKLLANPQSKKELFKLNSVNFDLPREEIIDEDGKEIDEKTKDNLWGNKYANEIIWPVKKAFDILDQKKERDTPMELLNASLEKLNHPNMDLNSIETNRIDEAMKVTREIQYKASELEDILYKLHKQKEKLVKKFSKKS